MQAIWRADVAEFTAIAWAAPVCAATAASNAGTFGPCVKNSEHNTDTTASMSSWRMSCLP